jgi:DNA-binding LacI/PurR family transcriptional regulator
VAHLPIEGDWTTRSGHEAGLQLAGDPRVTAVFAANDQMALGVIKALSDSGRTRADPVSVVGFDGVPESAFFRPSLTTVRFDFAEVGRRAVDHLVELMGGAVPDPAPRITPELIVRESTRSAPGTTPSDTHRRTRT